MTEELTSAYYYVNDFRPQQTRALTQIIHSWLRRNCSEAGKVRSFHVTVDGQGSAMPRGLGISVCMSERAFNVSYLSAVSEDSGGQDPVSWDPKLKYGKEFCLYSLGISERQFLSDHILDFSMCQTLRGILGQLCNV